MKIAFSEDQIRKRVHEMSADVSRDYGQEVVHLVGILDDSFIFLADLARKLTCPVVFHFTKMETRDGILGVQPVRSIVYGPITNVKDKHLLLVDAMVDSGITLDHLVQQLLLKKPKSIRTASLVDREDRRRVPFHVDYSGFSWNGGHLVGYGMDQGGLYRNLPYVAEVGTSNNGPGDAHKGGSVRQ